MTGMPVARETRLVQDPLAALARLRDFPLSLAFLSQGPVGPRARYSYVMADPEEQVTWNLGDKAPDPLKALAGSYPPGKACALSDIPPFQGGWAGMAGYGYGRALEKLPGPPVDEFRTPDIVMGHYRSLVAFDRLLGKCWLVSNHETPARSHAAIDLLESRLGAVPGGLGPATTPKAGITPAALHPLPGHALTYSQFTRPAFEETVARAIEYIRDGDCFQVNLAQRLCRKAPHDPLALLESMASVNPAPFAAWLDWGEGQVISASPERFLRVVGKSVEARPIKGTRQRANDPARDAAIAAELSASPKDRAENIMIVDLLRNDIGKVCEYGTVKVPRLCELESYPGVHHLVSEVVGTLAPGKTALDLLLACFPGGSVTGAPKIRSMEIITELERVARGPYCGSMFWIGHDGNLDSSILIRTATNTRGWLSFPVGGGIVADSSPAAEYDETMHKAAGILAGIEAALGRQTGAEHVH